MVMTIIFDGRFFITKSKIDKLFLLSIDIIR